MATRNRLATRDSVCAYRALGPAPCTMTRCQRGRSGSVKSRTWRSSVASPAGPMPPCPLKWRFKGVERLKIQRDLFIRVRSHLNHNHIADRSSCVCSSRRRRLAERSDFLPSPRANVKGMYVICSPSETNTGSCMARKSQDVADFPESRELSSPDADGPGDCASLPDPSRAVAPPDGEKYRSKAASRLLHSQLLSPNKRSLDFDRSPSGPEIAVSVCPPRGPGATPTIGNCRGLGTGRGRTLSSIFAI